MAEYASRLKSATEALWHAVEQVWFEFDSTMADRLSLSGNPWLAAMLPLALARHEPLELEAPVDPLLLEHAQALQGLWTSWYPALSPIPIAAERGAAVEPFGDKTAAFFSGGVDSFYTVLHSQAEDPGAIDELIFVRGADILLDNQTAYETAVATARDAAQELGLPLLLASTNLRSTRYRMVHWDQMGSGPLLGAIGLALESRYRRLLISSTWSGEALHPAGSHPETDPLFSTERTSFVHYGDWADRIPKTEYISQYQVALDHLRVCWESPRGDNCGHCLKCLRTMVVLEVIDKLRLSRTFPAKVVDVDLIRRQYLGREWRYFRYLIPYTQSHGRQDIAEAILGAFERTARLNRWMLFGLIWRFRLLLAMTPWAHFWLAPAYQKLRRMAVWINHKLPSRRSRLDE